jgi:ABC-type dipeptide/oligopeptide/nickel transport system ATPase subunit
MIFKIEIEHVQHIAHFCFEVDLSKNSLLCLVGKNGCGKTTLVRSIRNLAVNDTFQQTGAPYIFDDRSRITYSLDEQLYEFKFNNRLKAIDSRQIITKEVKQLFGVELPIPHGRRFSHFLELVKYDADIRSKMSNGDFEEPTELIAFLTTVYGDDRFKNLKKVSIKSRVFYAVLRDQVERYYIREDYLSSGEYFLISLYRYIQEKRKCIVIDEIDIALDSSAQVKLIAELRRLCALYEVNIVFTTHSLALMETLEDGELQYLEKEGGDVSCREISHNYAKGILFGFYNSWDKYILTEDVLLANFIQYLINKTQASVFSKYTIIHVGTAQSTVDLKNRNDNEEYFSHSNNVLCILDGDQREEGNFAALSNMIFIPYESIEKELGRYWDEGHGEVFYSNLDVRGATPGKRGKSLMKHYAHNKLKTEHDVFDFLMENSPAGIEEFKSTIIRFLS